MDGKRRGLFQKRVTRDSQRIKVTKEARIMFEDCFVWLMKERGNGFLTHEQFNEKWEILCRERDKK